MRYSKDDLSFLAQRKRTQKRSARSLSGRCCVVAGCTSGIGLATARRMARGGARLVLVGRDESKLARLDAELTADHGTDATFFVADFASFASIRKAARHILDHHDRIDVLVNSAGVYNTRRHLTVDGREQTFQVNHLSSFLFMRLLVDAIKKSPQGRILQVNSEGHRFGSLNPDDLDWAKRPYLGLRAYGASKMAQIMTVMEQARRLEGTQVTILAVHPGAVRTAIGQNNGPLYRLWMRLAVLPFLKEAHVSAEALYWLAAEPAVSQDSGSYFNLTHRQRPQTLALDEALRLRVWALSLHLCGLSEDDA